MERQDYEGFNLENFQNNTYEEISGILENINGKDYNSYVIKGLIEELYDQHHRALFNYKKAFEIEPTLFVKASIARSHAKISHWKQAVELFISFPADEFKVLLNSFHSGIVFSYLPYTQQSIIKNHYKKLGLSFDTNLLGMLMTREVNRILKLDQLENSPEYIITVLINGRIPVNTRTVLADYVSEKYLELLSNFEPQPCEFKILSEIADRIENEQLKKFDEVDGWLTELEGRYLKVLAESIEDNSVIVEIGGWKGKSSCFLAYGALCGRRPKVYSIDPHEWSDDVSISSTIDAWYGNIKRFQLDKIVSNIRLKSEHAAKNFEYKISLLFIDGDHRKETVQKDILMWKPHLKEGAYIAFHDAFFESVFDVLENLIWPDLNFRIVDLIEGLLVVQYLPTQKLIKRSYKEVVLWIDLIYRKTCIRSFLEENNSALVELVNNHLNLKTQSNC